MSETTYIPPEQKPIYHDEDEITLKELILKVQEYFWEVVRNWKIVGLGVLMCTAFFLYRHFTTPVTYTAKVKFLVEGEGGSGGGLASLARQFGLGTASGGGESNPYQILEVGKSSKLTHQLLAHNVQDTLIGNLIIQEYELHKNWEDSDSGLKDFVFEREINLDDKSASQAFNSIRNLLWGSEEDRTNALMSINYDKEKGIYTINSKTVKEEISIALVDFLYDDLRVFFEYEVFENQLRTKNILKNKVDSLATLRQQKNYELAAFQDANRNLVNRKIKMRVDILSQDITAINIAYSEALKNLELTDIALKDIQPLFMKIEGPVPPIMPSNNSILISLLIALFLGSFFAFMFIILRKIVIDSLHS